MVLTYNEQVGRGLDKLNEALKVFVQREMERVYGSQWENEAARALRSKASGSPSTMRWDVLSRLNLLQCRWEEVFRQGISPENARWVRSWIGELQETRNRWAHPERPFDREDSYRALDTIQRFLEILSVDTRELRELKQSLMTPPSQPVQRDRVLPSLQRTTPSDSEGVERRSEIKGAIKRNPQGAIINAVELTANLISGQKVLCPACNTKVFEHWPFGWDAHSAHRCDGIIGPDQETRKERYKNRFRHLFK